MTYYWRNRDVIRDMITNRNEAKTVVKHISCDCKRKFNSTRCN